MRNALNEQATLIQDALDVATIQDDIIRAVKDDSRMVDFKRVEILKELDGKILPLTMVYPFFRRVNESYSTSMLIRWVTLRFVWTYSRRQISDRPLKSISVGIPSLREVIHYFMP
jgi:hypothetical protein